MEHRTGRFAAALGDGPGDRAMWAPGVRARSITTPERKSPMELASAGTDGRHESPNTRLLGWEPAKNSPLNGRISPSTQHRSSPAPRGRGARGATSGQDSGMDARCMSLNAASWVGSPRTVLSRGEEFAARQTAGAARRVPLRLLNEALARWTRRHPLDRAHAGSFWRCTPAGNI